jgi:hypothetical protein
VVSSGRRESIFEIFGAVEREIYGKTEEKRGKKKRKRKERKKEKS